MEARRLIEGSSYGPNTLQVIFQAFDEAWGEIAKTFDDAQDIELARMRLAHAILAVAAADSDDAESLKDNALQVMTMSKRQSVK